MTSLRARATRLVPSRLRLAPLRDVRSAALRVALIASAVVFVCYVVIAASVLLIVNRNLTAAVDDRLSVYVSRLSGAPAPPASGAFPSYPGQRVQEPLLIWVVLPTGEVGQVDARGDVVSTSASTTATPLPDSARTITSPTTVRFADGSDMRVDGAVLNVRINDQVIPNSHVIVGQTLANVTATKNNVLAALLIVCPVLLLAVFFGAYAVGRRVGSPIERARQRQIAMTADASHELRTPLSVIEAQTSLALEKERDAAWYRKAFEAVGVESKRMRRLVDDLLWLARFDSTERAPTSEATDLGVLALQAAERFEAVAEARGISLRVGVGPGSTMISAPPEWLDRLLGVLLDNACRYTPAGGTVEVSVTRRETRVRLAVDDSGPGIPPEERTHIFDRFRRASDAPGGSGLGLAIAAAVVSASGGRWDVGTSAAGGASMAVSWTALIRDSSEKQEMGAPSGVLAPPPPPQPA